MHVTQNKSIVNKKSPVNENLKSNQYTSSTPKSPSVKKLKKTNSFRSAAAPSDPNLLQSRLKQFNQTSELESIEHLSDLFKDIRTYQVLLSRPNLPDAIQTELLTALTRINGDIYLAYLAHTSAIEQICNGFGALRELAKRVEAIRNKLITITLTFIDSLNIEMLTVSAQVNILNWLVRGVKDQLWDFAAVRSPLSDFIQHIADEKFIPQDSKHYSKAFLIMTLAVQHIETGSFSAEKINHAADYLLAHINNHIHGLSLEGLKCICNFIKDAPHKTAQMIAAMPPLFERLIKVLAEEAKATATLFTESSLVNLSNLSNFLRDCSTGTPPELCALFTQAKIALLECLLSRPLTMPIKKSSQSIANLASFIKDILDQPAAQQKAIERTLITRTWHYLLALIQKQQAFTHVLGLAAILNAFRSVWRHQLVIDPALERRVLQILMQAILDLPEQHWLSISTVEILQGLAEIPAHLVSDTQLRDCALQKAFQQTDGMLRTTAFHVLPPYERLHLLATLKSLKSFYYPWVTALAETAGVMQNGQWDDALLEVLLKDCKTPGCDSAREVISIVQTVIPATPLALTAKNTPDKTLYSTKQQEKPDNARPNPDAYPAINKSTSQKEAARKKRARKKKRQQINPVTQTKENFLPTTVKLAAAAQTSAALSMEDVSAVPPSPPSAEPTVLPTPKKSKKKKIPTWQKGEPGHLRKILETGDTHLFLENPAWLKEHCNDLADAMIHLEGQEIVKQGRSITAKKILSFYHQIENIDPEISEKFIQGIKNNLGIFISSYPITGAEIFPATQNTLISKNTDTDTPQYSAPIKEIWDLFITDQKTIDDIHKKLSRISNGTISDAKKRQLYQATIKNSSSEIEIQIFKTHLANNYYGKNDYKNALEIALQLSERPKISFVALEQCVDYIYNNPHASLQQKMNHEEKVILSAKKMFDFLNAKKQKTDQILSFISKSLNAFYGAHFRMAILSLHANNLNDAFLYLTKTLEYLDNIHDEGVLLNHPFILGITEALNEENFFALEVFLQTYPTETKSFYDTPWFELLLRILTA